MAYADGDIVTKDEIEAVLSGLDLESGDGTSGPSGPGPGAPDEPDGGGGEGPDGGPDTAGSDGPFGGDDSAPQPSSPEEGSDGGQPEQPPEPPPIQQPPPPPEPTEAELEHERSRALAALGRVRTWLRMHGRSTLPPSRVQQLRAAFEASFPGQVWNDQNAARMRSAVERAHIALRSMELVPINRLSDIERRIDGNQAIVELGYRHHLPAMNSTTHRQIALFPGWQRETSLRTTRLIHEAFHPLDDRGDMGSAENIEHGPPSFDNAFSFQKFVSDLAGVTYDRERVDRQVERAR